PSFLISTLAIRLSFSQFSQEMNSIHQFTSNVNLLRRSMTQASYSGENNKGLSNFGLDVIKTSIALNCNLSESCAIEETRLGLQNIIRVPIKGNSSAPPVVCSGFRDLFGAIAVDTGKVDDAGKVFLNVHRGISSTFLF
ncbi:hypothetical protein MKX01_026596, partial [Papaver californicum]